MVDYPQAAGANSLFLGSCRAGQVLGNDCGDFPIRLLAIVTELFLSFATGNYSLKTLAARTREQGIAIRGRKLYASTLHQILRKRIYTGGVL